MEPLVRHGLFQLCTVLLWKTFGWCTLLLPGLSAAAAALESGNEIEWSSSLHPEMVCTSLRHISLFSFASAFAQLFWHTRAFTLDVPFQHGRSLAIFLSSLLSQTCRSCNGTVKEIVPCNPGRGEAGWPESPPVSSNQCVCIALCMIYIYTYIYFLAIIWSIYNLHKDIWGTFGQRLTSAWRNVVRWQGPVVPGARSTLWWCKTSTGLWQSLSTEHHSCPAYSCWVLEWRHKSLLQVIADWDDWGECSVLPACFGRHKGTSQVNMCSQTAVWHISEELCWQASCGGGQKQRSRRILQESGHGGTQQPQVQPSSRWIDE